MNEKRNLGNWLASFKKINWRKWIYFWDIFSSNDIQIVANRLERRIRKYDYTFVMFPLYDPELDFDKEYDVVGTIEGHRKIIELLNQRGYDSIEIATTFWGFFSPSIPDEKKKKEIKEAYCVANQLDFYD